MSIGNFFNEAAFATAILVAGHDKAEVFENSQANRINDNIETIAPKAERSDKTIGFFDAVNQQNNKNVSVEYYVENDENSPALGFIDSSTKKIVLNRKSGNKSEDKKLDELLTIVHEYKHFLDNEKGVDRLSSSKMSPKQICANQINKEVTANIATLIVLREKYLQNGDASIFYKAEKGAFAFYGDALKNGDITPNSKKSEDFDKEMKLIVSSVQKNWMEKNFPKYEGVFSDEISNMAMACLSSNPERAKDNEEAFSKAMDITYKIGGVDFAKYSEPMNCPKSLSDRFDETMSTGFHKNRYPVLSDTTSRPLSEMKKETVEIPNFDADIIKKPDSKEMLSFVEKNRNGADAIKSMRERLSAGHEDKFAFLQEKAPEGAEALRALRFSSASKSSGMVTPTRLSAEKMRGLQVCHD